MPYRSDNCNNFTCGNHAFAGYNLADRDLCRFPNKENRIRVVIAFLQAQEATMVYLSQKSDSRCKRACFLIKLLNMNKSMLLHPASTQKHRSTLRYLSDLLKGFPWIRFILLDQIIGLISLAVCRNIMIKKWVVLGGPFGRITRAGELLPSLQKNSDSSGNIVRRRLYILSSPCLIVEWLMRTR